MGVRRFEDADAFLAAAGELLLAREAEHNLIFGLCDQLRRDPLAYGEPAYLAVVETGGRVVGAALRTPPHNPVLSDLDEPADLDALVDDLHRTFGSLPGVLGPKRVAAGFVRRWEAVTGARARLAVAERIHRAATVRAPAGVPGRMRPYEQDDRELVLGWLVAFLAEALPDAPSEGAASILNRRVGDPHGGLVLWEDGAPVSLAGFGGRTPNGIRIGPVYTPPERRGQGYASALTAELTRHLLEHGRRFCFLFTDLANPTSNAIYARIGYEPVADVDQWSFGG